MKSKRNMLFIGQIIIILILGVGIDKIIQVDTQSKRNVVPYINEVKNEVSPKKEVNFVRSAPLRKAEDVWANQESKRFEAEDRYTNVELANMIMDGQLLKVERTINIDRYDKKEIDKEVEKIKSEIEKQKTEELKIEKMRIEKLEQDKLEKAKSLIYSNNDFVIRKTENSVNMDTIQAFPHTEFKSYMAWTALSPTYAGGKLCAKATRDPETSIMTYEGRYLVALGSAYAKKIGQKFDVVMEDGTVIPVMVGDFKADKDTDNNNSTTLHDGSIIEFIVSSNEGAAEATKKTGSYNGIFPGKIKEFREIV